MLSLVRAAFGARKPLDPPADALTDSLADIEDRLATQIGVIAADGARDIGCLFCSFDTTGPVPTGMLHRVSVLPDHRHDGVAAAMVRAAAELAVDAGMRRLQLIARRELPTLIEWWRRHGFVPADALDEHRLLLATALPARVQVPTAAAMRDLGSWLAQLLRPGDLIIANGELGAGKTTLAQGIGAGLRIDTAVTSPTFVLSRIHRGDLPLVHVDAYRLASVAELDDLDLDEYLAEAVTLVEWGAGLADHLAADRLEIDIDRSVADDESRTVTVHGVGARWQQVDLWTLVGEGDES